jgi:NADPH:quinone reductase-like Zn-dependent oxidoreductase
MVAMIVSGPSQIGYLAASTIHGKRRVRFVQSPPTGMILAKLASHVDDTAIVPVIDGVYDLDDAAAAHRSLEVGGGFGKRVIRST